MSTAHPGANSLAKRRIADVVGGGLRDGGEQRAKGVEASGWARLLARPRKLLRKLKKLLGRPERHRRPKAGSAIALPVPRQAPATRPRVAAVLGEPLRRCLKPELRLVPLSRLTGGWRSTRNPSTFSSSNGQRLATTSPGRCRLTSLNERGGDGLHELLAHCQAKGIPTALWGTEDPVRFEAFIEAARGFDHVFMVDARSLDGCRRALGHERVHALPLAAQPRLHNPLKRRRPPKPRIFFAGAWRGDAQRAGVGSPEAMLSAALGLGLLDIYDRRTEREQSRVELPEPYRSAVKGRTPGRATERYHDYTALLDVDEGGAPSRRVFEALACATPVITSAQGGTSATLDDAVIAVQDAAAVVAAIRRMIVEPEARDRQAHRGYRLVHTQHTYTHRAEELLVAIGRPAVLRAKPLVSLICVSSRPRFLDQALRNLTCQTYPEVEIVFVMNSEEFDPQVVAERLAPLPRARCLAAGPGKTLAEGLNMALDVASGEFFAKMDDDDHYGPHYIADAVLAAEFSGADIIGKLSHYCYLESLDAMTVGFAGHEFKEVSLVHGATIMASRRVTEKVRFLPVRQGTDTIFLKTCREQGFSILSADRFNFVYVRRADPQEHTYPIGLDVLLKSHEIIGPGLDLGRAFV